MNRHALAVVVLVALEQVPAAWAQPATLRLTADEAVTRALEASHRLASARARQAGAQATVRLNRAAARPIATASAGYSRTNEVNELGIPQLDGSLRVIFPNIPSNVTTRVGVQWPIYTSGRTEAIERAAAAEVTAIGVDIDAARADLRLETVRAYWAVATARETVRVIQESVLRADAQVNDARERLAVGLVPPNEVLSFEAQRSTEQLQMIDARNLYESSLVDLRRLMGVEPDAAIELIDAFDAPPAGAPPPPSERPERRALALRIGGAEERQQAAATGTKPNVAVGGGVDYANPNAKIFPREGRWQTSWDASVNVSWNIFDSGRTKAQVAEAQAAVLAAREQLAELDTVLAAEVRQRQLDLQSGVAAVQAAQDGVRAATEARRVIGDRFGVGVATNTDVLVAQEAMLDAQLARTRAFANVRLAEARLDRALGRP